MMDEDNARHLQGKTDGRKVMSHGPCQKAKSHNAGSCIKLLRLPWAKLTLQDVQRLESVCSTLCGREQTAVKSACNFISSFMSKDYPAEIFLQKPGILFALVNLLAAPLEDDASSYLVYAVQSLDAVTIALHRRILFFLHPDFSCNKEECCFLSRSLGTSSSFSSEYSQSCSAATEAENESASSLLRLQEGDVHNALPMEYLYLPDFCAIVLRTLLPLLRASPVHYIASVVKALLSALSLLKDIVAPCILLETNSNAVVLQQELKTCMQELEICIKFYKEKNTMSEECAGDRLLYTTVSVLTWKFLDDIVGVNNSAQVLPTFLKKALEDVVMDSAFQIAYPAVHSSLLQYISQRDDAFGDMYKLKELLSESIISAHKFFKMSQSNVGSNELVVFYSLFASSLPCLPYLADMNLIKEFVTVYSNMYMHSSDDANSVGCNTLVRLLNHSDVGVREEALKRCTQIVKDALPLDSASLIPETQVQGIQFMLQHDIIECIVTRGLRESCKQGISDSCATLLMSILHSKWLLPSNNWKQILLCLTPIYPILQCYADIDTTLGSYILTICNPDTLDGIVSLSTLECLMSNIRNLFFASNRVKEKAWQYLLILLVRQESSGAQSSVLQDAASKINISEIFCSDRSYNPLLSIGKATMTEQFNNLESLLAVVGNIGMDPDIRASCLLQVSVIVEDQRVQAQFQNVGGDDIVRKILDDFTEKMDGSTASMQIVLGALRILKARVLLSNDFRTWLSGNESYCFTILRCFLLQTDLRCIAVFPVIFAAIAFHRFFTVNIMEEKCELCLPGIYLERFCFPFAISSWDQYIEENSMVLPEVSALDNIALSKQFPVLWHREWLGGDLGLIKALQSNVTLQNSPHITALKHEVNLMMDTSPRLSTANLLVKLGNATAHAEALIIISRLRILVQVVPSYLTDDVWELSAWKAALNRFLVLVPTCSEDAELLRNVFLLLEAILLACDVPLKMLEWIWRTVLLQHGPCQHILLNLQHLLSPGDLHDSFRLLAEALLKLMEFLLARSKSRSPEFVGSAISGLGSALSNIEISQPFNLVLLQNILSCLHHALVSSGSAHAKGSQPPISRDSWSKVLTPLIEIVASFHCQPQSKCEAHMGLRIMQLTALCLHQLADRMLATGTPQWEQFWVQPELKTEIPVNVGLTWLLPLWTDPDAQIRAAGLGIAVSMTCSMYGQKLLTEHLQQLVGGLWGIALSFLHDHDEAGIVREQAVHVLCNLTSKLASDVEHWQGPVVRDTDNEGPSYGRPALLVLLQHCDFYKEISNLICCYYHDARLDIKALNELAVQEYDSGVCTLYTDEDVTLTKPAYCHPSICTASLLGILCRLLQNLVILYPEQATSEICNHQLHLLFLRCILGGFSHSSCATAQMTLALHEIIKLVTQCALQNICIRNDVLRCSGLFVVIFTCIGRTFSGPAKDLYSEMWKLLSVLLELEGVKAYEVILMCITFHWNHVGEWLTSFLEAADMGEGCGYFFTVLCQLCSHDYKHESILSDQICFSNLLDSTLPHLGPSTVQNKVATSTAGECIATSLTRMIKGSSSFIRHERNVELELLMSTLSSVLSISQTAKDAPSHAGLLEILINDVTYLCDAAKQCKAKQSTNISHALEQRLELLQNAVFQSSESKLLCCSLGLPLVILQSWQFISGKSGLLVSCLKLLVNLTADCLTACHSLTRPCALPGGTTLTHHLVQLAQEKMKEVSKGKEAVCRLVFGVICNLSLADDFRKFLSKVNFVEQCITLLNDPDMKRWQLQMQQTMWLKMIITVTSSAEGQKLVGATEGALTLLCEWSMPNEVINDDIRWNSMLVLRNLCFLPANKRKLLATGTFLKSLELQLDEPTGKHWLIVGSTLWALLANYNKAKALIHGNKPLCAKIYDVHSIVKHGESESDRETTNVFGSVIGILERQN